MSDVKNLYILKQPITAVRDSDIPRGAFCKPGYDDVMVTSLPASWDAEQCGDYELKEDLFNKVFEPLDVESLTTQLETLLRELGGLYLEAGQSHWCLDYSKGMDVTPDIPKRPIATVVVEVLELLGMKGKQ